MKFNFYFLIILIFFIVRRTSVSLFFKTHVRVSLPFRFKFNDVPLLPFRNRGQTTR